MKARVARPRLENVWDYVKEEKKKKRGGYTHGGLRIRQMAGGLSLAKPTAFVHESTLRAVLFRPYKRTCVMISPRDGMMVVV